MHHTCHVQNILGVTKLPYFKDKTTQPSAASSQNSRNMVINVTLDVSSHPPHLILTQRASSDVLPLLEADLNQHRGTLPFNGLEGGL